MIENLKEGPVQIKALITKADMSRNTKGTPYLSLVLEDAGGVLDAKYWNLTEEQCAKYRPGQIVEVRGDLILYRNAFQLRVRNMEILEDEPLQAYIREAPMSGEEMEKEITGLVESLDDPVIYALTSELFEKYKNDFLSYPAAVRNHHNYVGGLAYHSLTMARTAQELLKIYPFLNRDLLLAGVLLHDMGKLQEYTRAVLPEYSAQGNLLGHISMMASEIDAKARELGIETSEQIMLLRHMVLSHHGKLEYGSPVLPMIPEAEVLSLLDNLDARLEMMKQNLSQVTPGTFGPRVFALDNRMLYRRRFADAEQSKNEQNDVEA